MDTRSPAILLIGPTGAGKTPLGQHLETDGFHGRRCAHFDFGTQLRAIAADRLFPPGLSPDDLAVIHDSLATGSLLEDEHFAVAAKILRGFVAARGLCAGDLVILNGIPRHVGQARDMDRIASVEAVISLECSPQVVYERISRNTGGDRAGRVDDDLAAISRKIELFADRTAPLLDHYRQRGVPVHRVTIATDTSPADIVRQLPRSGGGNTPPQPL